MADKAEAIRQKIDEAVENKAQLQDCVYVGEVLEYSKLCDVIKEQDKQPQRFKASSEFRIKRELLDSSDDDDKQDEVAKKKKNSEGNGFSGDPDGHFQYVKQNENDAVAHTFICDLCQNVFQDTNELRNHEAMHSMEFYHCMQCLKVFRSVCAFDNHRASHMASHTCQTCGKVFQLKTSLTNHMQIHSDHKMKCSVPGCKKTFRWRQNQLEHIQWGPSRFTRRFLHTLSKFFQTPTSMQTHRVNKHGFIPDITPGHPLGDPNRITVSKRKPSTAGSSAKSNTSRKPSAAAGSADGDTLPKSTDDFDENIIDTLVIK